MYSIKKIKKVPKKMKFSNICELEKLNSFLMPSRTNGFTICDQIIRNIRIFDVILARPMVIKMVDKKYKKVIAYVTELLISDDDSGDSFRLALTEMEKFRQEIKNKYRAFLEQEELNFMAKQLSMLQKQAKDQFAELQNNLVMRNTNTSGKNR